MSSRVQKGGQVFRPVAKSRGRINEAVSRTSSAVPESARTPGPSHLSAPSVVNEDESNSSGISGPSSANISKEPMIQPAIVDSIVKESQRSPVSVPQVSLESQRRPPILRSSVPDGSANAFRTPVISPPQGRAIPRTTPVHITPDTEPSQLNAIQQNPDSSANAFQTGTHSQGSRGLPVATAETVSVTNAEPGPSRGLDVGTANARENPIIRQKGRKKRAEPLPENVALVGDSDEQGMESRMLRPRRESAARRLPESHGLDEDGGDSHKPRRRRQQSYAENDNISGSESEGRPRRRRRSTTASSTSTRRGRTRTSSGTLFDADANPGQDIDPTAITMAEICQDTGQGRISSKAAIIQRNHLAWKASNREKREKMRAIMEAKKLGQTETEVDAPQAPDQPEAAPDSDTQAPAEAHDAPTEAANGDEFNYRQTLETNRFSVKVRIGPNGETIIDEESLHVDRTENDESTDQYQHVEESDQTKFTNSSTYTRKLRGSRWSAEETELFFHALSQFGENYELISYVLPGRDRKACKNKFKAEDKRDSARITYCLTHKVPYDIQTLSRLTGKDFSGPTPEIRVPDVVTLAEPITQPEDQASRPSSGASHTKKVRKKSRTPSAAGDAVEVLGNIDDFES